MNKPLVSIQPYNYAGNKNIKYQIFIEGKPNPICVVDTREQAAMFKTELELRINKIYSQSEIEEYGIYGMQVKINELYEQIFQLQNYVKSLEGIISQQNRILELIPGYIKNLEEYDTGAAGSNADDPVEYAMKWIEDKIKKIKEDNE